MCPGNFHSLDLAAHKLLEYTALGIFKVSTQISLVFKAEQKQPPGAVVTGSILMKLGHPVMSSVKAGYFQVMAIPSGEWPNW